MRLLIVETDSDRANLVIAAFARRHISCDHAATLEDARQLLSVAHYAAVILDPGLPDGDGLTLLRALRDRNDTIPVLILSAGGDVRDRIAALHDGADDYLLKPFEFEELFARLTAVLRRQNGFSGNAVNVGNLRFDLLSRELLVAGTLIVLSQREIELAELLLRRAGRVVAKSIVEDQLFGMSEALGSNAVEVYVHRLRRKLERAGATARIETIRGVGYLMRPTQ